MGFKDRFKDKMEDRTYEEHLMKNYIKRRERAEDRANNYSYFLAGVCVLVAVMFFVFGELWLGLVFIGIGALLVLMVYLSKKEENKEDNKIDNKKKK
ncbi:MAG: hypothetical protein E7566_03535 [Ruminococcaceae bacterium]|nr:hypothetical protein [Oscillospiraceae bacterium]